RCAGRGGPAAPQRGPCPRRGPLPERGRQAGRRPPQRALVQAAVGKWLVSAGRPGFARVVLPGIPGPWNEHVGPDRPARRGAGGSGGRVFAGRGGSGFRGLGVCGPVLFVVGQGGSPQLSSVSEWPAPARPLTASRRA